MEKHYRRFLENRGKDGWRKKREGRKKKGEGKIREKSIAKFSIQVIICK
jgi:hypothetical protein